MTSERPTAILLATALAVLAMAPLVAQGDPSTGSRTGEVPDGIPGRSMSAGGLGHEGSSDVIGAGSDAVPALTQAEAQAIAAAAQGARFEPAPGGFRIVSATGATMGSVDADGIHLTSPEGPVQLLFSGSAPRPLSDLPGVTNRLIGDDPSQWRTGITRHDRIQVPDVAPGVDVEVYFNDGVLEFDYVLAPGADAAAARFEVTGATPSLTTDGGLALGGITLPPPVSFQGDATLATRYVVDGRLVRLAVAGADASQELRIDPKIVWSTYHGGSSTDNGLAVATWDGDIFITGYTSSDSDGTPPYTNFPIKGAYDDVRNSTDGFAARIDGETGALVWSTYVGGASFDYAVGIDVDDSGVVVVGYSASLDMPTEDAYQPVKAGAPSSTQYSDAFIVRLSLDGQQVTYGTYLGGYWADNAVAVAVRDGVIYVGGRTTQASGVNTGYPSGFGPFPTTLSAYQRTPSTTGDTSPYDLFLSVLDPSAAPAMQLVYSTLFGSPNDDYIQDLALDAQAHVFLVGSQNMLATAAGTYPAIPTKGADGATPYQETPGTTNGYYPFIARFDTTQSRDASLVYATYIRGTSTRDYGAAVAVNDAGEAYIAGRGQVLSSSKASDVLDAAGVSGWDDDAIGYESWVVRLAPDASAVTAGTYYGSDHTSWPAYYDYPMDLQITPDGKVLFAMVASKPLVEDGIGYSTARPWHNQPWQNSGGDTDYVLARFTPDLTSRDFHFATGSPSSEPLSCCTSNYGTYGNIALLDGEPVLYLTLSSSGAPIVPGAFDTTLGSSEGFIVRLGTLPPVPILTATNDEVSGTLVTKGTHNGEVRSFTGTSTAWMGTKPYTQSTYTVHMLKSLPGDNDEDLSTITWEWDVDGDLDFDDTDVATDGAETITISRDTPTIELVCVRMTGSDALQAVTCVRLPFVNRPPVPVLTSLPDTSDMPICTWTSLDASTSYDPDKSGDPEISNYEWDFDTSNGITVEATGATAEFRTAVAATRAVRLTVYDGADPAGSAFTDRTFTFTGSGVDAEDDAWSVKAGKTETIGSVIDNDCYPAGSEVTAQIVETVPSSVGRVTWNTDGTFTIDVAPTAPASHSFEYELRDAAGNTDRATVHLTIRPVNEPPVATDTYTDVPEDTPTPVTFDVTDPDEQPLTIDIPAPPAGIMSVSGGWTYTPAPDFCHADGESLSFVYEVSDPLGLTASATATLRVVCAPDAPRPADDFFAVPVGQVVDLDVLANDVDVDPGDAVFLDEVGPAGGPAAQDGQGVRYSAGASKGFGNFTYRVVDATGRAATASAVIWVYDPAANTAPFAPDVRFEAVQGVPVDFRLQAVDDDPPVTISYTLLDATWATVEGDLITYESLGTCPDHDRFTYEARDLTGLTGTGTVTVVVECPNRPPVPAPDALTMAEDSVLVLDLLSNDADPDGDELTVVALRGPGTAAIDADAVAYRPPVDQSGVFDLEYDVSDGFHVVTGTARVTVTAVDDPPRTATDEVSVAQGSSVLIDVLANDEDPEQQPLTIVSTTRGVTEAGMIRFTPTPGMVGPTTFTYTVTDGNLLATGMVRAIVTTDNAWPDALGDSYQTQGRLVVPAPGVLQNDNDDGAALQAVLVAKPRHGALSLEPDGGFVYTPQAGFTGIDMFRYAADDGDAAAIATATIFVSAPARLVALEEEPIVPSEAPAGDAVATTYDVQVQEGRVVALHPVGPWRHMSGPFVDVRDGSFVAPPVDEETVLVFELAGMRATVVVTPGNNAPTVAVRDVTATAGDTVSLAALAEDADGDRLTYTWRKIDGPDAVLSSVTARVPTFVVEPGIYVFQVTVSDGIDKAVARTTVTAHAAPVLVASFEASRLDTGWWFTAHHRDGLTYAWDFGDGTTAEGRDVVHAFAGPGPHTVRLTVRDALGNEQAAQREFQDAPAPAEAVLDEAPSTRSKATWFWPLIAAAIASLVGTAIMLGRRAPR